MRSKRSGETAALARANEDVLLTRLRAGDEDAFGVLVERYHTSLVRLARTFVASPSVAEEVVQDTWLGVLRGIDRFEGRCSLQTWLYRILVNRARTTGVREHRHPSLSLHDVEPAVAASRFGPLGEWAVPPPHWSDEIDDQLAAVVLASRARDVIDTLPDQQRQVVTLRDERGLTSQEVCDVLDITEGHQRVLLHRARSRVRGALERQMAKD